LIFKTTGWVVLGLLVTGLMVVLYQARRTPSGPADYVALGSSFAAGPGLGQLQDGSPLLCARTVGSYPQQLARSLELAIVDMSCGGATTNHLLLGGQFFQGPQVRVINRETRLVTITIGGNDIGYVGDLSMLASRNSGSFFGRLAKLLWTGPKQPGERDYERLHRELSLLLRTIHARAPKAIVVVATYPAIVPQAGTCPRLGLSSAEAKLMREVSHRLAATTRDTAREGNAVLVDMHELGARHHACSSDPWTSGWTNGGIAPFHPTRRGAQATAAAIATSIRPLLRD
jgi:lysophospholipase L1-like esterase